MVICSTGGKQRNIGDLVGWRNDAVSRSRSRESLDLSSRAKEHVGGVGPSLEKENGFKGHLD
jgi:hypothetical protein